MKKIDKTNAPAGYIAIKPITAKNSGLRDGCFGCAFHDECAYCDSNRPCTKGERKDKRTVIFIKNDTD